MEAVANKFHIDYDNLKKLVNHLAMKNGGIAPRPEPLKSGVKEQRKKEDVMKQSQKLLLTWLIENAALYGKVKAYITPADFTEELYSKVAQMVYAQFEETGSVNPAMIINMFQDEEEQNQVAGLFNATIHEVDSKQDLAKAIKETIIRVKTNSMDERSRHLAPDDMAGLMQVVQDKKDLERLEKLVISID